MAKNTVLITGASGFLGRPLVGELLKAGYSIRATTRSAERLPRSVEAVVIPDLRKAVDWKPVLAGVNTVIHLAGLAHPDARGTTYEAFDSVNRLATQNLALSAARAGVERFMFLSSVRAQAGASAKQMVREIDEACPTDAYGRTKLAAETALRASGVPFTILRPVAVYGPRPIGHIQALLRLARTNLPLPFLGLTGRRSLLGIDNLTSSVLFLLNNPAAINETYLIADPKPLTLAETVSLLRKAQGRQARQFYVPPFLFRLALGLMNRREFWARLGENLIVDPGKLQALGWRPVVDTYDGLATMIRAERSPNPR
ncbi:MAG TPA: NAD-dependent epimerase/dehydratase family protein [Candidatus Binataceae bacterium]|nr:NAD-dependent epimerase/dehydratase family protein [Candidatus Binataceae bacterium]